MRTESKISLAILLVLGIVFFLFMTQKTRSSARTGSPAPIAKAPPPTPAPDALASMPREEARAQDERRRLAPETPDPSRPLPLRIETPSGGAPAALTSGEPTYASDGAPASWSPAPVDGAQAPARVASAATTPAAAPASTQTPSAAPATGAGRTHTIEEGDSLWAISLQYYGKGTQHALIRDANKDLIPDPDVLPVGVKIRIPELPAAPAPKPAPAPKVAAAALAEPAAKTVAPDGVHAALAERVTSVRTTADGKRLYTIEKGDTLEKISKRFYGSKDRKVAIQEANQIADPNQIWEGQVLVIPQ